MSKHTVTMKVPERRSRMARRRKRDVEAAKARVQAVQRDVDALYERLPEASRLSVVKELLADIERQAFRRVMFHRGLFMDAGQMMPAEVANYDEMRRALAACENLRTARRYVEAVISQSQSQSNPQHEEA